MMRLYHGSNVKIEVPDLIHSKPFKDFGRDFYHFSPEEAIDTLYTSDTFDRLQDDATGLYYQSPGYVYSFLLNELKTARVV